MYLCNCGTPNAFGVFAGQSRSDDSLPASLWRRTPFLKVVMDNGLTDGIDWSDVGQRQERLFVPNRIDPNYADSTPLFTGSWGSTQTVQAVVYISAVDSTTFEE